MKTRKDLENELKDYGFSDHAIEGATAMTLCDLWLRYHGIAGKTEEIVEAITSAFNLGVAATKGESAAATKSDKPKPDMKDIDSLPTWGWLNGFARNNKIDTSKLPDEIRHDVEAYRVWLKKAMSAKELPPTPKPEPEEKLPPPDKSEAEEKSTKKELPTPAKSEAGIVAGMRVAYQFKGEDYESEVLSVDEALGTAACQPVGTSKVHRVKIEKLELAAPPAEVIEPEPEPKPKGKGKGKGKKA